MRAGRPSNTAQYVAVVRAILHARGAIDDSYAKAMLTPTMRAAFVASRAPLLRSATRSGLYAALAARTLVFDAAVTRALDDGITQVAIIGAGYDSRAWRLARKGVRFFEVDHPATQQAKRERAPVGGPVFVPVDLERDDLGDALAGAGLDPTVPTQFVIEGVTMYLLEDDVRALLIALYVLAADRSRLAVNFAPPPGTGDTRDRWRQRSLRALGIARGERHVFFVGADGARTFVDGTGWSVDEVVRLGEFARNVLDARLLDLAHINPEACAVNASKDGRRERDQLPAGDGE